ncbi:putative membrane protein [Wickerhamomyces ciferrii]|uniref:Membrane protein n=1 Tax=Wickerhamomyces ciferrii (strain ATCC 14091 / BCRC 22168 / CBS 111 / JCM 3599 / NBRC 0793 / NRRL Y-1031 F-60-10) TaxID=1206466 RepID=K0KW22_WICCF|nr:uncharacterized protein BN7_4905 [Wickerhamomyces ciferrii]CCH45323.1 putative membrane protein [Wickerhamomyces ciferrii]
MSSPNGTDHYTTAAASTEKVRGTTTSGVTTALITNGVIFCAFVTGFIVLRLKFLRIYLPKSSFNLINEEKKPEPLPSGIFNWIPPLLKKSDNFIIRQAGLDGYFFLRYLFFICTIACAAMLLFFPILLPINATGGNDGAGLDALSFSNVNSDTNRNRFYAHVIMAWIFYFGVLYMIYRELTFYTAIRQAVLASPRYAKKLSSRVVLFQTVPEQYLHEDEFKKLFDDVKKVWIARSPKELTGKVDTIDYVKEELPKINKEVVTLQQNHKDFKPLNSVFVEFGSQYSAQMAFQSVTHHTALHMSPRYIGLEPKDIVWGNLRMFWWERLARKFGAVAVMFALVIFWAFPVAFVGMISNINYIIRRVPFLKFLNKLPKDLFGILTTLLPTVALSLLMMLLPMFIRFMGRVSGASSVQQVELFTQQTFFAFQVIQVFLITTLSSSAASTAAQIAEEPTKAMNLLSENLPKASNFYISYIILQGFSVASGALCQVVTLVLFYVMGKAFDNTPRKMWKRFTSLGLMSWGTIYPIFTNLAVIIFSYAIISPIILLFATFAFFLCWVAYLYNLTYAFGEAPDARGMYYPRALFQTIVGVYLGEICLLGLFLVAKAWGPLVLQAICLGFTVFIHTNLNSAFDHLMTVVPLDAMKPLDGKSDTPSYNSKAYNKLVTDNKRFSKDSRYAPSQNDYTSVMDTKSQNGIPPSYEMGDLSRFSLENARHGSIVPLLADGDNKIIPPAPLWKRFLQPHIYLSYKVCKTRVPDIYNYMDPADNTDPIYLEHAYDFPDVTKRMPYLWIPRDQMGLSTVEIENFKGIIDISDERAMFNSEGQPVWTGDPPSYEDSEAEAAAENSFREGDSDEKEWNRG